MCEPLESLGWWMALGGIGAILWTGWLLEQGGKELGQAAWQLHRSTDLLRAAAHRVAELEAEVAALKEKGDH